MATNNSLNTGVTPLASSQGGTGVNAIPTTASASHFAAWDASVNLPANSFLAGYATTATAGATTTLSVTSAEQQFFTGTLAQTVLMPVTSTLTLGQQYQIVNNSSGVVTVQSSGAATIQAMAAGTILHLTVILTSGTTAASWFASYESATGSGSVSAGTANQVGYYAVTGNVISGLASANNALLVTSATGVPSIGNAILADITINGIKAGRGGGAVATNTVFGAGAYAAGTSGARNTVIGNAAAAAMSAGNDNTLIGHNVINATAGSVSQNTMVGSRIAEIATTCSANVFMGYRAAGNSTTPSQNIVIGHTAGFGSTSSVAMTTASNNVLIGYTSDVNAADCLGAIAIGSGSIGTAPTGVTSADLSPGIALGSSSFAVGVSGDSSMFTGLFDRGWWRPRINDFNIFIPAFVKDVKTGSASMVTTSVGTPILSAAMTNGQVIIGSTGATPTAAALTPGTGISITNAAGSITIANTGSLSWASIAGTTQTAAVNTGYVISNASATTVTLPATAALGSVVKIAGTGTAGWILLPGAGQTIEIGSSPATTSVTSDNQFDCIELVCTVANTTWVMLSSVTSGFTIV